MQITLNNNYYNLTIFFQVTSLAYTNTNVAHLNQHLWFRNGLMTYNYIKFYNSDGGHFVLENTDRKTHISAW